MMRSHEGLLIAFLTSAPTASSHPQPYLPQIPRFLYDAGLCKGGGMIACTQPRRVAAVTVAQRVADEMGTQLGGKVRQIR